MFLQSFDASELLARVGVRPDVQQQVAAFAHDIHQHADDEPAGDLRDDAGGGADTTQ